MEKKIYLSLSAILFVISIVSTFIVAGFGWISFLSLAALSLLFFWSAKNLKHVLYSIIIILPFAIKFNYYKLDISFISRHFGLGDIFINLSVGLYLFVIFLFVTNFITRPKIFIKTPLFFPLVATSFYFAVSVFWSEYPMTSFTWLIYLIAPFGFYFLCFLVIKTQEDLGNLIYCVAASTIIPLAEGLFQLLSGDLFYVADSSLGRVMGTFTHPNNFGSYLSVIVIACLVYIFSLSGDDRKKNSYDVYLKVYLVFVSIFLFLTFSRTAWASVLIFIFLHYAKKWKVLLALLFTSLCILSALLLFESTQERVAGIFQRNPFDPISARQSIAKIALEKASEKPYFGYGIGTFEEVVRSEKESFDSSSFPHNDLILFTLEGGIIGALLYLLYFCGAIIKAGNISYKKIFNSVKFSILDAKIFAKGIFLMLLVFLIAGVAEAIVSKASDQIIIWSLLGAWFSLMHGRKSKNDASGIIS